MASSSIGGEVQLFDSKYKGELSCSIQNQLALIYRTLITQEEEGEQVDPHIKIHVPAVQQQRGRDDCGIFAIAFALHSLLGDQLLEIEFDQGRMRGHLLECFQKKELTPFPRRQKVGPIRSLYFPYRDIELYCVCLMPDTWKRTMIECDGCSQWYHTECVGLQALPPPTEQWTCSSCS